MNKRKIAKAAAYIIAVLLLVPAAWGRSNKKSLFKYVAGTEPVSKGCEGKLEVTGPDLVFECAGQSIAIPYDAVRQMEFLPRISKKIRKMKLHWAVKPPSSHGKHEGFFAVIYSGQGQIRAIILKVRDETMRPYMAEIDLKTGHPIESRKD
jgi:hypothetical protein